MTDELEEHLMESPRDGYIHPNPDKKNNIVRIKTLENILEELQSHDNNREFIT